MRGLAIQLAAERGFSCYEDEFHHARREAGIVCHQRRIPAGHDEPMLMDGYVYFALGDWDRREAAGYGPWIPCRDLKPASRLVLAADRFPFEPVPRLAAAQAIDFYFGVDSEPVGLLWGGGPRLACAYCQANCAGELRVYLREVVVYARPPAGARNLRLERERRYFARIGAGRFSCRKCRLSAQWDDEISRLA